jgi:hypothetical protein
LAEAWPANLRTLCERAGLELDDDEQAALDTWSKRVAVLVRPSSSLAAIEKVHGLRLTTRQQLNCKT